MKSPSPAAASSGLRTVTRQDLIRVFSEGLAAGDVALAAWLGGSDANARADEWSDVDLNIVVPDGRAESAFAEVERLIEGLRPIARRYRLPSPTWHGAEQCFYQLEGVPEWLMVDLCVFARSQEHQFLDRSRHGEPVVLFDKEGLVRVREGDPAARQAAIEKRLAELRARFELLAHLPAKEVRRGREVDALAFYHALVLRPLVDLLRIRYCPERFDFSMRYLDADQPADVATRVKRLAYVAKASEIPARVEEARAWFREEI
jgi:hypothetical protein